MSITRVRPLKRSLLLVVALAVFSLPARVSAHPQFTTLVILDVSPAQVAMELHIPLGELELAWGHDASKNTDSLIERAGPQLKEYLLSHIHPQALDGKPWTVEISDLEVEQIQQTATGPYQRVMVHLLLKPPPSISSRKFLLNYDVVMHQVPTHTAFITVRNDWEGGKTGEPSGVGVIKVNEATKHVPPFEISLEKGSWWHGLAGMVQLGKQHIREGTDHLLFLFTLLIPAPLLFSNNRWQRFGGTRYSITRLLRIVTAFTIGHSITLLVGALGLLRLPQQPVEVLIAFSILVSAVHAIRPIFPGKEMFVAGGFGLVHGLGFASVLSELKLTAGPMAISILGFNLGIELMQLAIIAVTVPWLILLSLRPSYRWLRIVGATFAGIAALAWITERVTGNPNVIGNLLVSLSSKYAKFGVLLLALSAIVNFIINRKDQLLNPSASQLNSRSAGSPNP